MAPGLVEDHSRILLHPGGVCRFGRKLFIFTITNQTSSSLLLFLLLLLLSDYLIRVFLVMETGTSSAQRARSVALACEASPAAC